MPHTANYNHRKIKMKITIRKEQEEDFRRVEELTREAFWNRFVPGCDEHYLAHIMRNHPDFIGYLDLVALYENEIIGQIMYTRSWLLDESDKRMETLTFGPISVLPPFQRKGVGSELIRYSAEMAARNGEKAIIIQGHPQDYCKHGFKSSKDFQISDMDGRFPYSLLVLELQNGVLQGHTWRYCSSDVYNVNTEESVEFDKLFEPKKKQYKHTQEEFSIASRAYLL